MPGVSFIAKVLRTAFYILCALWILHGRDVFYNWFPAAAIALAYAVFVVVMLGGEVGLFIAILVAGEIWFTLPMNLFVYSLFSVVAIIVTLTLGFIIYFVFDLALLRLYPDVTPGPAAAA